MPRLVKSGNERIKRAAMADALRYKPCRSRRPAIMNGRRERPPARTACNNVALAWRWRRGRQEMAGRGRASLVEADESVKARQWRRAYLLARMTEDNVAKAHNREMKCRLQPW